MVNSQTVKLKRIFNNTAQLLSVFLVSGVLSIITNNEETENPDCVIEQTD